ncbi:MAG: ketopantoate reductase apbA/panE protein, partial [Glaciihabitans sp.]|nr:ketopantoate reductase apbA/panE protein [Glaciihabitans sp.]
YGAPHFEVEGWVTSYQAIGNDEIGEVSDDIERLTGHPAQSFAQFLEKHPESYSHLL